MNHTQIQFRQLLAPFLQGEIHRVGMGLTIQNGFEPLTQADVTNIDDLLERIEYNNSLLRSTYLSSNGFPFGHPTKVENPLINYFQLFIDTDVDDEEYKALFYRLKRGEDTRQEIIAKRKELLPESMERATAILSKLKEEGKKCYCQLSGHKGAHIIMRYPLTQFTSEVGKHIVQYYLSEIDNLIGTDTSCIDSARLLRLPNTINAKISYILQEPHYCVPISAEDLMNISSAEEYDRYTSKQRYIPTEDYSNVSLVDELLQYIDKAQFEVKRNRKRHEAHVKRRHAPKTQKEWREFRNTHGKYIEYNTILDMLNVRDCCVANVMKIWENGAVGKIVSERARVFVASALMRMYIADKPLSLKCMTHCFKHCPDYAEETTRNKIEMISEHGDGDGYTWSCENIKKEFGDEICSQWCLRKYSTEE